MQVDRDTVVEMVRAKGDDDAADRAAEVLPDPVDTDRDAGILADLDVDPAAGAPSDTPAYGMAEDVDIDADDRLDQGLPDEPGVAEEPGAPGLGITGG